MKVHYISLCYLGGEVDLVKLRAHLAKVSPGTILEMVRRNHIVTVPLASGRLELEGTTIPYGILCHQYDTGFGTVVHTIEIGDQGLAPAIEMARKAMHGPGLAAAALTYFNRVFGTREIGELYTHLKRSEARGFQRSGPGSGLFPQGCDYWNVGINEFDCLWLVGGDGDEARRAGWLDLTAGRGLLLAGDTNRFWSADDAPDLYWDMAAILTREHLASCFRNFAYSWMGTLNQHLKQYREGLAQGNEELWSQYREEVENLDINLLAFRIYLQSVLLGQEQLYRRDHPPANLVHIEPQEWERLSRYRSRRAAIDGLITECQHIIERMTVPLDFREFKLLRTGVEQLEARIMLLTVLLVIMELFTQLLEPGHWPLKGLLMLLLLAIPGGYLLWERTRRARARRRGRVMHLKNLRAKAEEEAREKEQQMAALKEDQGIDPALREYYLGIYQDLAKRMRGRAAELDSEISDNEKAKSL